MNLVTLMYKYINRFINSDELLESLEELDLNNFSKEEKISINKLIDDIKIIILLLLLLSHHLACFRRYDRLLQFHATGNDA